MVFGSATFVLTFITPSSYEFIPIDVYALGLSLNTEFLPAASLRGCELSEMELSIVDYFNVAKLFCRSSSLAFRLLGSYCLYYLKEANDYILLVPLECPF